MHCSFRFMGTGVGLVFSFLFWHLQVGGLMTYSVLSENILTMLRSSGQKSNTIRLIDRISGHLQANEWPSNAHYCSEIRFQN